MSIFQQHPALSALVAFYLFSALVSGMPDPVAKSITSTWYIWLYNTLHILSANLNQYVAARGISPPAGTVQATQTTTVTAVPPRQS